MSNEAIEAEWQQGIDELAGEPCAVCKGQDGGCTECEWTGSEGVRMWGSSPYSDDADDPERG
jgi:hypothetical protein